jgi:hypothetical protein
MSREFILKISKYLDSIGIDPLYFFLIITIPIYLYFNMDELKRWKKLSWHYKFYHIITIVGLAFGIIIAILKIIGILNFDYI